MSTVEHTPRPKQGRDLFELDEDECGCPWDDFVTAVGVYVYCHMDASPPTVRQIGDAFHVTDELVRAAVAAHYWAFLAGPDDDPTKQRVELDGE